MNLYNEEFYETQHAPALASARVVLPLVGITIPFSSVVDFGCGSGAWLHVAKEIGCTDTFGIDGTGVDPDLVHDFTQPLDLGRKFDLAISLEVAEHLPSDAADIFIDSITAHADNVLFSAAIPGQPGVNHINCQWQSYWASMFEDRGFTVSGDIRWQIWSDGQVFDFYRQNLLLASCSAHLLNTGPLDVVHPARITPWWDL